uniref:Solute carrier family 10 member 6-like n=1 Tax=Saccoglossus kowalevskii TaxID=10224 RepID=A0ABM0GW68_SACKO|nr:PREDICTED: solute carrier family 10 member 6-like [Saccoglossus kowalevskii]
MPLLGLSIAHMFQLSPEHSLGLISIATCPGGAFSNVLTYWTRGDTCLSICMTTCSTMIGIGMMPLNLYIYSRSWSDAAAAIPYIDIIISLTVLLVPCSIGMFILWKWPKVAGYIAQASSVLMMAAILTVLGLISAINPTIFYADWKPHVVSAVYPLVAFGFGYLIPFIFRQRGPRCRTIAFETGVQNSALALTIINLMLSRGKNVLAMMVIPSLHAIYLVIEFLIVMLAFRYYFHTQDKKKDQEQAKLKMNDILADLTVDQKSISSEMKQAEWSTAAKPKQEETWKSALVYAASVRKNGNREKSDSEIQTEYYHNCMYDSRETVTDDVFYTIPSPINGHIIPPRHHANGNITHYSNGDVNSSRSDQANGDVTPLRLPQDCMANAYYNPTFILGPGDVVCFESNV